MTGAILLLAIAGPLAGGVLVLLARGPLSRAGWGLALLAALGNLGLAIVLFQHCQPGSAGEVLYSAPWAGFGLDPALGT